MSCRLHLLPFAFDIRFFFHGNEERVLERLRGDVCGSRGSWVDKEIGSISNQHSTDRDD